jgi:hypothetical protein
VSLDKVVPDVSKEPGAFILKGQAYVLCNLF